MNNLKAFTAKVWSALRIITGILLVCAVYNFLILSKNWSAKKHNSKSYTFSRFFTELSCESSNANAMHALRQLPKNGADHLYQQLSDIQAEAANASCDVQRCVDPWYLKVDNDYLLTSAEIPLIKGLKNPCFCVSNTPDEEDHFSDNAKDIYCLPYFLIAGYEKCGTSDFYHKLREHQHYITSVIGETHWFDHRIREKSLVHNGTLFGYTQIYDTLLNSNKTVSKLIKPFVTNHKNLSTCPYILGDQTPRYFVSGFEWQTKWYHTYEKEPRILDPHKIKLLLPDAKIIMILRNPIDRLLSSYIYFRMHYDVSSDDFHMKVLDQIHTWETCLKSASVRNCMYGFVAGLGQGRQGMWGKDSHEEIRHGIYHLYLQEWFHLFPREQFLILRFEDYKQGPLTILEDQVLPFLHLDPFEDSIRAELQSWEDDSKVFNKAKHHVVMQNNTKDVLRDFYKPYNIQLAQLMQDDRFLWE